MEKRTRHTRIAQSHLFTIRIWHERMGENQKEWRGQIEQVLSGKIGYFRSWEMLISFMEEALAALEQDHLSIDDQSAPGAQIRKNPSS